MKHLLKIGLQAFLGLVVGLVGGASIGGFRHYPEIVAVEADDYLGLRADFAYFQYKHADRQHAKQALLGYLDAIHWLKEKQDPILRKRLAFDSGLTYLRLFRLEQASNNAAGAEQFMQLAQAEFSSLGWKDVSETHLQKSIETREAGEVALDSDGDAGAIASAGRHPADVEAEAP